MFGCMDNPLKAQFKYQRSQLRDRKRLIKWIVENENKLGSNGEIIYTPLNDEDKERCYRWIFSDY